VNPRNLFAVGAAGVLLSSYLAWDWYFSPQAQVERLLKRAAGAAEERNLEDLLSCLSTDFTGFHNMDYGSTSEQIQKGFEQVDRLNVTLRRVLPEVEGSEATVSFDATVVAVRGEQRFVILGTVTQPERLRANLRLEEGEWKIYRVELSGDEERRE
jgi:hypothetical protein